MLTPFALRFNRPPRTPLTDVPTRKAPMWRRYGFERRDGTSRVAVEPVTEVPSTCGHH